MAKVRTRKARASGLSSRATDRPRRRLSAYLVGAVVLFVVGLVAITTFAWSRAARSPAPPGQRPPAPDFTVRLLERGAFTLSEQRGNPVLILFTASWCLPCIPEVNKLAQLQEEFGGKGLRQLVVSVDPADSAADFAGLRRQTRGTNLPWGLDVGQKATIAYGIRQVDTKVLIDQDGREVVRYVGPTSFDRLRQPIAALLP